MRNVLTFVLAGGKGERLNPLTQDRAKPAVPFGGIYRIIDFTLSNCVNSDLRRIYVLIQYKSFSLQKHIVTGWDDVVSTQLGEFIEVIPAQQRIHTDWYKGTADAIHQNIFAIEDHDPELVLILAGDHLYKMDYTKLVKEHKDRGADMTVACMSMPKEDSIHFGVIEVDKKGFVTGFQEKPEKPKTIPGKPKEFYGSMGIYLFNKNVLIEELEKDAEIEDSNHDFGKDIIPMMIRAKKKVLSYDFMEFGKPNTYWRDIGTRDAYYQANMELVGNKPPFNLYDRKWPLRTHHSQYPPVRVQTAVDGDSVSEGVIVDSVVSPGCTVEGGYIEKSVLSPNVTVKRNATVRNSIIMDGCVINENVQIQNAIVDKQNIISAGDRIGFDLEQDRKRFVVTSSGIVIVSKRVLTDK